MTEQLSYEGFKHVIVSQIKNVFPKEYNIAGIFVQETIKNNDVVLENLFVDRGKGQFNPSVNLNDLYKVYQSEGNIEAIMKRLAEWYCLFAEQTILTPEQVESMLDNLETVRSLIECRLINRKTNAERLRGRVFKKVGEFALSYQIKVGRSENGFYMMQITDELLKRWEIDVDELHDIAVGNMNLPQNYVLEDLGAIPGNFGRKMMLVLTNKTAVNGATVIISEKVREAVAERVGGDYYILPSSINELMIVPKDSAGSVDFLQQLVRETNRTDIVPPEEFLSDYVYRYDAGKKKIMRAAGRAVR